MARHKEHNRHGGSSTPQYFCPVCEKTHTRSKTLGKKHYKYWLREKQGKQVNIEFEDLKYLK